jgi:hypothetical protein
MPSPDIHTANISRRRSPISPINPSSRTQSRPSSSNSDQLSDNSTACLEICQYGTEGVGGVPAGWLNHHFSSLPGLHDSIGKDIPGVQWRKSDIYLRNDYRTSLYRPSKQFQHVDTLTPDPAKTIRERQRTGQQSRDECIMRAVTRMTILPTALGLARQLVKTDRHLASALALAHERDLAWAEQRRQTQEGRANFSQPVTSPVQVSLLPNVSAPGEEQCEQHDLSDASSRSNAVETIPNPPIPGDLAPLVDALFARVNSFAKTRGFGVIKAHGMIRPGQRSRYVFQCDWYGAPRPGRGAGLRKRKPRKLGCLWKIIAEALLENGFQWTLRHFPDAEHHKSLEGGVGDKTQSAGTYLQIGTELPCSARCRARLSTRW